MRMVGKHFFHRDPAGVMLALLCCAGTQTAALAEPAPALEHATLTITAATDPDPLSPEQLEQLDTVLGDIRIRNGDIFDENDPEENGLFYRIANTLHIQTRENVIRRQLLVHSGDPYTQDAIAETERLLRTNKYIQTAEIRPIQLENGEVDLEVLTEDTWTLSPQISFSHKGGASTGGFEFEEANLLGTGSDVKIGYKSRVERNQAYFGYRDNQLGASRMQLDLSTARADDGSSYRLLLEQPFYALNARRAGGVFIESFDQVDPLYQLGEVYDEVRHDVRRFEVFHGWSEGLVHDHVSRYKIGLGYDAHSFDAVDDMQISPYAPADRRDVYPFVAWEWLENHFEQTRNADNIARIEDRFLGSRVAARLGYASTALGSDDDAWVYALDAQRSARLFGDTLMLHGGLRGRQASRDPDSYRFETGARWYHRQSPKRLLYAELSGAVAEQPDTDEQLTIGGDNGLRGYPMRYQAAKAVAILTLEQRFYTDWYPFRLFRVGAVMFADVGRAWGVYGTPDADLGLLRDVGVGLRIGNSRSSRGSMLHIDVAYPLDGPADIRHAQFILETSSSF
jgi:hypothetical protein